MASSNRTIWIAGNWKMNLGLNETTEFFDKLSIDLPEDKRTHLENVPKDKLRVAIFPAQFSISVALSARNRRGPRAIQIGSQNIHWEDRGAYTGEVSGIMAKEIGVEAALVAHSERRQYFGETHATAQKRAASMLRHAIPVIFCIGETGPERTLGKTEAVLRTQIEQGIPETLTQSDVDAGRFCIAYEPVWAIGTGVTATPAQAQEAHAFVRKIVAEKCGDDIAQKCSILYGGSVTPENIDLLLDSPDIDGALVGGASLKPDSFSRLILAGIRVSDSLGHK